MTKWRSFGRGIQKEPVHSRFYQFILENLELYNCWDRNPAQRALRAFGIPSCSLRFPLQSQMSHVDGFTGIIVICLLFLIFFYHEINISLNLWLWSYTELMFLKVHNNCCAFFTGASLRVVWRHQYNLFSDLLISHMQNLYLHSNNAAQQSTISIRITFHMVL